jgi:excinuclease ABC subunit A
LYPSSSQKKREIKEELHILLQKGFTRIYIHETEDGKNKKAGAKVEKIKPKNEKPIPETTSGILRIEELLELGDKELNKKLDAGILPLTSPLSRHATPSIFVLIDRIVVKSFDEDEKHRISDSANTAFYEGEGSLVLEINGKKKLHFSNRFELDGLQFEEPVPNLFSFNNPYGACPTCEGFSQILGIDENLVIPNKQLSLYEDAIAPWKGEKLSAWKDQFIKGAKNNNFPIHKAIIDLSKEQWQLLWQGNEQVRGINDFFKEVEQNLYKVQYRVLLSRYRGKTICTDCNGYRLRKEALYVKVNEMHIGQLCEMPVKYLQQWFGQLKLSAYENQVAKRILLEINHRIKTLMDVGLGYLTLNRLANSLSGGESQRIQLTRSLGSNLTNSLYILDEPSIGLHSRDTEKLITVLKELRNLGNTVIVVEHDEQMMREADYIIDMGPLASHLGGEVIAYGNYDAIIKNKESLTGKYLSGNLKIEPPKQVRKWNKSITIKGARQNNLQNIDVTFPLQVLCTVSGVSGSGKTTLVKQILYPALKKLKGGIVEKAGILKP